VRISTPQVRFRHTPGLPLSENHSQTWKDMIVIQLRFVLQRPGGVAGRIARLAWAQGPQIYANRKDGWSEHLACPSARRRNLDLIISRNFQPFPCPSL
jgi:hypothetical protein